MAQNRLRITRGSQNELPKEIKVRAPNKKKTIIINNAKEKYRRKLVG